MGHILKCIFCEAPGETAGDDILEVFPSLKDACVCDPCKADLLAGHFVAVNEGFVEEPNSELILGVILDLKSMLSRIAQENRKLTQAQTVVEPRVILHAISRIRANYAETLIDLFNTVGPEMAADVQRVAEGKGARGFLPGVSLQLNLLEMFS